MIKFFRKNAKEIIFSAVIVLCAALIVAAFVLLKEYSDTLDEQARTRVENYASDTNYILQEQMSVYNRQANHISERVAKCTSRQEVALVIREAMELPEYESAVGIRFFNNGEEFHEYADVIPEGKSSDAIREVIGRTGNFCIGLVDDKWTTMRAIAFYASVADNEYVDGVVLLYPTNEFVRLFDGADAQKLTYADTLSFCSKDGDIMRVLHAHDTNVNQYTNVFDYLRVKTNDKAIVDDVERKIKNGKSEVFSVSISGVSYVVSLKSAEMSGGYMCLLGLYETAQTHTTGYKIVNSILSTIVIIFIILIALLIYLMINGHITKKRIYEIGSKNKELGCLTVLGFQNKTEEILKRNKVTRFALVSVDVRFFNYITEHYGAEESSNLLKYLNVVYKKALELDETYGYHTDGQFFLLMHYREDSALVSRLGNIHSLARRYPRLLSDNYTVKLNFGVYEIDREEVQTVQNMMDKAIVAKNTFSPLGTEQPLKFYTSSLRENYIQTADIESRAEGAIANDEFVVFYQPKLNVSENCIEGAEALVRWYDPANNVYRSPATFLPIFETNGFIVRLDYFVYEKVCRYIMESIERRQAVYPVSVNISRLTAIQPDFVDKYVKIKNQYHIPDNLIILEFTESFAYEKYEVLNDTINHMHRNGFLCAIDDFGSGYSSYNILKSVNMDEIKLDAFFIQKGISEKRDRIILESVIKSAKEMGMKVTQEGVETKEDLDVLIRLGCDVVQGYYYSKPLALTDYITFLNQHVKK